MNTYDISGEVFAESIAEEVRKINPAAFSDPEAQDFADSDAYRFTELYANEHCLRNTAIALPLIRYELAHAAAHPDSRFSNARTHRAYLQHALSVCRILIDLRIPVDPGQEDILLAGAVCHIFPENIRLTDAEEILTTQFHLDPEVGKMVALLFREDNQSDAQQKAFFERVQANKLALILKLADRGNLVEQLYGISSWSARSYIHETRHFFFPMCIYAKTHYPDVIAPVSLLMEKMKCLIEASEILLSRYEARESELTQEIMELQEENASIQRMIRSLQE